MILAFDNADSVLFEGKSVDDLLLTIYKFVGYTVLQNYGLYDIFHTPDTVAAGIEDYGTHLDKQLTALETSFTEPTATDRVEPDVRRAGRAR